jgi:uncharacterized membrane protein YbaN (DUF454 family)
MMKSTIRYIWSRHRLGSYRLLAFGSFGLGVAGVFLPLLPTTPFVLLGFWAATKAESPFAHWLAKHPRYGAAIQRWRQERSLPMNAKRLAWTMLVVNWVVLWYLDMPGLVLTLTAVLFLTVSFYLYRLPTSSPTTPERA